MSLKSPLLGIQQTRRHFNDGVLGLEQILYLLRDDFDDTLAAGAVDGTPAVPGPGTRAVVDGGSKLSLSGGNLVYQRDGSNDPGLWLDAVTRAAGVLMVAHNNWGNANNRTQIGFNDAQNGVHEEYIRNVNADFYIISQAIGSSVTASRDYYFAIVLRAVGAYYFVKETNDFANWTLLFITSGDSTASLYPSVAVRDAWSSGNNISSFLRVPKQTWLPTPLAFDSFTRANGAIGTSEVIGPDSQEVLARTWTGVTFTVSSNKVINTPTEGSELIVNGDFTNWTGDDPDNWSPNAPEDANNYVTENPGGECQLISDNSVFIGVYQSVLVAKTWYIVEIDITARVSGSLAVQAGSANTISLLSSTGSKVIAGIADGPAFVLVKNSACDITFDDVSLKALTLSSLFSSLSANTQNVVADVDLVMSTETPAGLVICLDSAASPANFIIGYHDGVWGVHLQKCVAGTYTDLISAAAAYSPNATLRIIKDDESVDVFYNGVKIGTTQTVSDVGVKDNTIHGLFSTYAGNTLDNFTLFPRKTTYNGLNRFIT